MLLNDVKYIIIYHLMCSFVWFITFDVISLYRSIRTKTNQLKNKVMKKLFTLESLITLLIIVAFTSMVAAVLAKSLTLLIIGIFIILIPLPVVVVLSERE